VLPIFPNVIVPAFSTPYVGLIFVWPFLLVAFVAEVLAFGVFNRTAKLWKLFFYIFLANLVSSLTGIVIGSILPSGYDSDWRPTGAYAVYATFSWVGAYILSVLIEYALLYATRHRNGFSRLRAGVISGNTVSYVICAGAYYFLYF